MLKAIVGFNYGPDDTRVNEGDLLADDFADADTMDYLFTRSALVPVIEPTPPASEPSDPKPSPNPRKGKKTVSGAPTAPEGSD